MAATQFASAGLGGLWRDAPTLGADAGQILKVHFNVESFN
jgi:hypothetical protein